MRQLVLCLAAVLAFSGSGCCHCSCVARCGPGPLERLAVLAKQSRLDTTAWLQTQTCMYRSRNAKLSKEIYCYVNPCCQHCNNGCGASVCSREPWNVFGSSTGSCGKTCGKSCGNGCGSLCGQTCGNSGVMLSGMFAPQPITTGFAQSSYPQPMLSQTTFAQPISTQTLYAQPVAAQSSYAQPTYVQPTYAQPMTVLPAPTAAPELLPSAVYYPPGYQPQAALAPAYAPAVTSSQPTPAPVIILHGSQPQPMQAATQPLPFPTANFPAPAAVYPAATPPGAPTASLPAAPTMPVGAIAPRSAGPTVGAKSSAQSGGWQTTKTHDAAEQAPRLAGIAR